MKRLQVVWHGLVTLLIVVLLVWWIRQYRSTDSSAAYPNHPIHVVVPFGAGGGSDTFVRVMQKAIAEENLLGQPLVIINQGGGAGTIGSRDVKNAEPDGYKILCLHDAIITAEMAGTADFGPQDFEAIAMTGELAMVIVVREDATFNDLPSLIRQAKETPRQVTFGANQGAPAYYATLQMEQWLPGADFSIVSGDGGADRYAKIIGGHLDAGIFSLSEFLDFLGPEGTPPDRNVRSIAIMSLNRHASVPEMPTAIEQGVPILLSNAHYWWAPKGTPKPIIETLASALEQAMQNETVQRELVRLRVDPVFDSGASLKTRLRETTARFESVVVEKPSNVPNFTAYVAIIVVVLFAWAVLDSFLVCDTSRSEQIIALAGIDDHFQRRPGIAAVCFGVLVVYVAALGFEWMPFAVASALMVFILGSLMALGQRSRLPVLLQLALLTALGSEYIFTQIFQTTLP